MLLPHPFIIETDLYPNLQCQTGPGATKSLVRKDGIGFLPGAPRVQLRNAVQVGSYLRSHLAIRDLETLAPYLFLTATPRSSHIWPLHHHQTKGRDIVIDEDPRLHLLWHKNKVYIKPIPPYLLSAAFWEHIQTADPVLFRAAAGFMRTYVYLIRHEIDFRRATNPEWELIPTTSMSSSQLPLTFERFVEFIAPFEHLSDADVSPRYAYGQLRLARVNHLTRLVLRRWSYFPRYSRLADELGYFVAAVLALFSVVSIVLGCMQVELAVMSLGGGGVGEEAGTWHGFVSVSRWFPVVMMVLVILVLVIISLLAIGMLLKQGVFTLLVLRAKKKDREKAEALSSSVVG